MIEQIVPRWVAVAEAFGDTDAVPTPEDLAFVRNAVPTRQREYATGRACARQALTRLGAPASVLSPGRRGEPGWPAGVVGSITHCAGYRASAVTWAVRAAAIGVDAEPNEPLPPGVLEAIAAPQEMAALPALSGVRPDVCWGRVLFSAKESVFKAWYPLTRRELDFTEATVTLDAGPGCFRARLLVEGPELAGRRLTGFSGRWLVCDGLVLTAVVVSWTA